MLLPAEVATGNGPVVVSPSTAVDAGGALTPIDSLIGPLAGADAAEDDEADGDEVIAKETSAGESTDLIGTDSAALGTSSEGVDIGEAAESGNLNV